MDAKLIIDKHYSDNYNYYRSVCYNYYRGRYLWEDLSHELYIDFLKIKAQVIEKFHQLGKLKNIGLKLIRRLYERRFRAKRSTTNHNGEVSPLHETPGVSYAIEISQADNKNYLAKELQFSKMERAIKQALQSQDRWFDVSVFLQSQDESILSISKKTRIGRDRLTRAANAGKEYLKQRI